MSTSADMEVAQIRALIDREIAGWPVQERSDRMTLADFRKAMVSPRKITVNFSGGITQKCWMVTRSNGDYRVIYLPTAGYFSLCVESFFGPVDIGVHGPAITCFSAV